MQLARSFLIWASLGLAVAIPVGVAATSPLLAWREPVYILAGLAGVLAMVLVLFQPLLAGGYLPGLTMRLGRRVNLWTGLALVAAVIIHVAGLWITSPPDVVDALLLVSPTPFSVWGVLAMWALFAAALLAVLRHRLPVPPRVWRIGHVSLVIVVVLGSVIHAVLIEGTMGTVSKYVLCALAIAATLKAVWDARSRVLVRRRGRTKTGA